jgi:RNA polymerase sigma-70 factor (ECF subfamily)
VTDDLNSNQEGEVRATATHLRAIPGTPPPPARDSLEGLFSEHYDRVFRAAYRVTGSVVDAEDVLQTVFLRLAKRGQELNLEPNPASYLHRAAINASLDLLRQRGRASAVALDDVSPELLPSGSASPAAQQEERELRRALRRAVGKLNDNQAEMFALRYFEDYDNQQIADLLGTSPMVVAVLLHRARARVKKEMGTYLEGGK